MTSYVKQLIILSVAALAMTACVPLDVLKQPKVLEEPVQEVPEEETVPDEKDEDVFQPEIQDTDVVIDGEQPALDLKRISTEKVCQLTGERDLEHKALTTNQTFSRFRLSGTDLGTSFEHAGKMWIFFGDSVPTGPGKNEGLNPVCGDSIAYSTDTQVDQCVNLDFVTHPGTRVFRSPVVDDVDMGCFNVPNDGLSLDGHMYVWFNTGKFRNSLLSRSDDDAMTFTKIYDFSRQHFITLVSVLFNSSELEGLPGSDTEWVMLFGSGDYRKSYVHLAAVPANKIEDVTAIQYFSGLDPKTNLPTWTSNEEDAKHLEPMRAPCVGELSVTYEEQLDLWMMTYNCGNPRGIILQTSKTPWGPWSLQQVIFNPNKDEGYCHFIHQACSADKGDCCDELAEPGRLATWGGAYGPFMMERFTEVDENTVTLYYVLSTWVPYNTVLMKTVLERIE